MPPSAPGRLTRLLPPAPRRARAERTRRVDAPAGAGGDVACLMAAAQAAITPSRTWQVSANMLSELDPERDYLAWQKTPIEPLRPEIMTPPAWDLARFLTPVGRGVVAPRWFASVAGATATPRVVAQAPTSTRAAATSPPSPVPPTGTAATATPRATLTLPATRPLPTSTPRASSTPRPTAVPPTDRPDTRFPLGAPRPRRPKHPARRLRRTRRSRPRLPTHLSRQRRRIPRCCARHQHAISAAHVSTRLVGQADAPRGTIQVDGLLAEPVWSGPCYDVTKVVLATPIR